MLALFVVAPVVAVVVLVNVVIRILFGGFLWSSWHRRRYYGCSPYYGGYGRGYYRRPWFGGLGFMLFLAAVDRFFDRHF